MKKYLLFALILSSVAVFGAFNFLSTDSSHSSSPEIVVFVSLDTLRRDHLGIYGYPRNVSPFIDYLGGNGALFTNTYAPMGHTSPSHASMFTGLYPLQHGILKNGHKLNPDEITLTQILNQNGFSSAAFVSVRFLGASGLEKDFEHFNKPEAENEDKWWIHKYRPAQDTVTEAIRWLEANHNKKTFIWLHLFDPHWPTQPPKEHFQAINKFNDTEKMLDFFADEHYVAPGNRPNSELLISKMNQYDAEILYVDTEIRRLYEFVKQVSDHSLWVLTADHGEGLWTHKLPGHGKTLYNEEIRVPLIVHDSTGAIASTEITQLSENVDILPSLLDLLEIEYETIEESYGCSWVTLILGGNQVFCEKEFSFSQRMPIDRKSDQAGVGTNDTGDMVSAQTDNFKYIYRTHGNDEFYNIQDDPYEQVNLVEEQSEELIYIRDLLKQRFALLLENKDTNNDPIDSETLEDLRALGYIQ